MAHSRNDLFDYTPVSLIYFVLWGICICLTRNFTYPASTMPFATQSADVSSTSKGYVDLQRSPSTGILMMSSTWKRSPRAGLTVPSSSPCATASKWWRVSRTRLGFPVTSLSPVKWLPWPYSVPYGLPIPQVYGYSPAPNNAAEAEYIFMEFLQGTKLSDIWFELGEGEIISVSRRLAELESETMSIAFPAGGSLYYAKTWRRWPGGRASL